MSLSHEQFWVTLLLHTPITETFPGLVVNIIERVARAFAYQHALPIASITPTLPPAIRPYRYLRFGQTHRPRPDTRMP